MRGAARRAAAIAIVLLLAGTTTLLAQNVSGVAFEDLDADGVRDAGEAAIPGVSARLYGEPDTGPTFDQTVVTAADGVMQFSPGNGCYLLQVADPAGWRRGPARFDLRALGSPGYTHPVGLRRFGGSPQVLDRLLGGSLRYTSIGDSIAYNWNSCFDTNNFWYSQQVRDRLSCVVPSATVNLDESAIKGEHTDDLLVDEAGELNNVFRVLDANPQLVTLSMVGNDLLDDEPASATPTQSEIDRFVEELIDSRSNLQEVLSALVSELPNAEIELNTLYDNLSYDCSAGQSNQLHDEWLPILNQILRDVAWGQARRVTNAEIYADFARADLLGGCTGFEDEICQFLDGIHPRHTGYEIIREKVWESLGGVNLGPKDALGATSIADADHGYLRHAVRLLPTGWSVLSGASVTMPAGALDDDDGGAAASVTLGIGSEEFRLSGFPDWFDEYVPVKVIAGVRYRTTGSVTDDFYRIEASVDGSFRPPPGHPYSTTDWNYYTPLVGAGGPNEPAPDPDYGSAELLVLPNVAAYRTVTATLTKNPTLQGGAADYDWPALTHGELGTTEIRLVAAPVAATAGDSYEVEIDAAWLDVYGEVKTRPAELLDLRVAKAGGGALDVSFDELVSSTAYNVYFGDLGALASSGTFDHGSGPDAQQLCERATSPAGPGRLQTTVASIDVPSVNSYVLATGMVDGVESPVGYGSDGSERDRSENVCP